MSKSAGTIYTITDLEAFGFTAMEVRYELLSAYYRKQANFTMESLHAKKEALMKLAKAERLLRAQLGKEAAPTYGELCGISEFGIFAGAWESLEDDLNTAAAIGKVFTGVKTASTEQDWKGLHAILATLGLILPEVVDSSKVDIPSEVQALAEARWVARNAKDWAKSDELRDALKERGWVAKDGKEGYQLEPI